MGRERQHYISYMSTGGTMLKRILQGKCKRRARAPTTLGHRPGGGALLLVCCPGTAGVTAGGADRHVPVTRRGLANIIFNRLVKLI